MTKELAQKLIAWYEESITMIEKEEKLKNILGILRERGINRGVCRCALVNFNTDIFEDSWVRIKTKWAGFFWGKEPIYATTKEDVIQRLQLRVDILKTFDGK